MDMQEIIAAIVGLILYWFFTQKKNKTAKGGGPAQLNPPVPPQTRQRASSPPPPVQETYTPPPMPEPEPFYDQDMGFDEPEPQEAEEKLPASFEELLQQFTAPIPKPEPRKIDAPFERPEYKSVAQTFKEERGELPEEGHSIISEKDAKINRDSHFKITKKSKNKFASILQNPQDARDAFILKEVFDRKYF